MYGRIVQLETEKKEMYVQKNKGWRAIGLSFLTLGIRPLIFYIKENQMSRQIKEMNIAHSRFSRSLNQMKQRTLEKELYSKPIEIMELEKQRLENLDDELNRLNSIPRIEQSLKKVNGKTKLSINHQVAKLSINHQVAYGHSLELREQLKDTHYIINHGQNLDLMLVNTVARKLKQEFEPVRHESFEPLRHDTALRHIKEDTHTVDWYQKQISKGRYDDHALRKELICGDCVLESTTACESAIDFFAGRTNVAKIDNPSLTNNLLLTIIYDYIPNREVAGKLCQDLAKLMNQCPPGGNLYSICVPKEKFNESCYFSKGMGTPLKNQDELRGKIDEMQSGVDASGDPQIRVLSHKIRVEDGYYVILNSTFEVDQLLKIEDQISLCIQEALTGYRIR
ncbi:MAG: hypothetical protein H0U27_02435 [Nitrosopumilus sp.]|nr:hypothetical protein [Nitrosopumilus sp.]